MRGQKGAGDRKTRVGLPASCVWAFPFLPNEKVRGGVRPDSQVILHLQPGAAASERGPEGDRNGKNWPSIHPSSISLASPDLFHSGHFACACPTRPESPDRVMGTLLPFVKQLSAMEAIKCVKISGVPHTPSRVPAQVTGITDLSKELAKNSERVKDIE